jgi:DNA-binding transcriptional LysR family regulator
MDPTLLKKLSETPITIALNGRQFRLLLEWLQVETLERTRELKPLEADRQAHAQAVQYLQELDEILAAISAAYRQAAEKLNLSLD